MVQLYKRKGGEFVANAVTAGDQLAPKVVALAGGGFVMIWTDASGQTDTSGTGLIGQRFDAAGNKLGGEFLVNSATAGDQSMGNLSALANGGFLVSWTDNEGGLVQRAQLFDAAGAKSGAEFALNAGSPSPEPVGVTGLSGGGFVAISYSGYGQVYDAAGAAVGASFDASGDLTFTAATAAAAPGGGFLLAADRFGGTGDLALQLFDAAGAKVGAVKLIDTNLFQFDQIGIVALAGGGYAVTWHGDSNQIFAMVVGADGSQVSAQIAVSADYNWEHMQPSVIARPDGGFVIAWTKDSTFGTIESLVIAQAFDAAGARDGTPFLVSTLTDHPNQNHGQSSVAMLPSGDLVVAWHGAGPGDPRSPGSTFDNADGGIRVQIFSEVDAPILDIVASGTSVNEIAVENTAVLRLTTVSEAVNTGYTYLLVADSSGGAFRIEGDRLIVADTLLLDREAAASVSLTVRATDLAGNTRDEVFVLAVTDAAVERRYVAGDEYFVNDTLDWNQSTPDIAALASGGYVVTWTDGSFAADGTGSAVKAQLFTDAGVSIGAEFVVNTQTSATQEDPAVTALASGGFVVAWRDNNVIKAQILDGAGAKVGGEIAVSTPTGSSDGQFAPEIASVAGGGFVVVWQVVGAASSDGSGQAIRMQLFSAAGTKIGGEQFVNTATSGDQNNVMVAGLENGGFVATWTDRSGQGGDASGASVKAQRFDAAGGKLGGEILVNTITTFNQSDPSIVAIGSGQFVITWSDTSAFPTVVRAQIFAADGSKIAGEIIVTPPGGGFDSSVTALADGGFAVSWTGNSTTPGEIGRPVRAQMFDLNGHKIGGDFEISPNSAFVQNQSVLAGLASGGLAAVWVDANGALHNQDIMARSFLPEQSAAGPAIVGTGNDDVLVGTQAADVIQGLGGNDVLDGREGDDRLEGGDGNDRLIAGLGDDLLYGGAGHDVLFGGEDDDEVYGEDGNDVVSYQSFNTGNFTALLDGGIGDDAISFSTFGLDATATLIGGDGNDQFNAQGGEHLTIDAGAGNDLIVIPQLGTRFDISLGAGRDLLQLLGYPFDFVQSAGTNVSDFAPGDGGDQLAITQYLTMTLLGWDQATNPFATGHLQLIQRGADAVIRLDRDGAGGGGYAFADLVVLQNVTAASLTARNIGFSADGSATLGMTIDGTADRDLLAGGGGNDQVNGLDGNDRLLGGAGNDALYGGNDSDSITGEVGDDLIYGGAGGDFLGDSHGNDQIYGEAGHDFIQVDRQLVTGATATTALLDGGEGNDTLIFIGRAGLDDAILNGGAGEDSIGAYGGRMVVINGGDGPEIINIDVTATSYAITLGNDPFSSDIVRLYYAPQRPLTSFTILDFTTGNGGDMLQMGSLLTGALTGWDGIANPFSTGHLLLAQSGADALIMIDRNGGDDSYTLLGRLQNVTASQLTALNLGFLPGQVALIGTEGNDSLTGSTAADRMIGLGGDDMLDGNAGNDILDGGAGADRLEGGAGDDLFHVDNAGDLIVEAAGGGNDRVIAAISYALGGNAAVETLEAIAGTAPINLTGNWMAQTLIGNAGANVLHGGGGADVLIGLGGNDVYYADLAAVQVEEGAGGGTDRLFVSVSYALAGDSEIEVLSTNNHAATDPINLTGNSFNQTLIGNAGENVLHGGGGTDLLIGLGGRDIYYIDVASTQLIEYEGGGNDALYVSLSYVLVNGEVEVLSANNYLSTDPLNLTGNLYNQTVIGNAGNNVLNGGGGTDLLIGLAGNDTYYVDVAATQIIEYEGGGNDAVYVSSSYTLVNGEVETLSANDYGSTLALNLTGNLYSQTIIGNAGKNILHGGGGVDSLIGLGGNDTYYIDVAGTQAYEAAGAGLDVIYTSVSHALAGGSEVETLSSNDYGATSAINLTGNAFSQALTGNAGANTLDGGAGADTLFGLAGADAFAFTTAFGGGDFDTIADFSAADDNIHLDDAIFAALGGPGALNANAFFAGAAAHDADDRIIYDAALGQLLYDADGNGAGAAVQFAALATGLTLTASDFQVI